MGPGTGARLLVAAALLAAAPARAVEVVRISVAAGVGEVEVSGSGLAVEPLREGAARQPVAGGRARLRLEGERLLLVGQAVDGAGLLFTSSGSIRCAGRELSGEVEVAPGLLAVPVPGHTAGSYCYVDCDRDLALVGDLVLSFPDGLARPLAMTSDDDGASLASLRSFAARAPSSGLAGHGPPVVTGFDVAIRGLAKQPRHAAPTPRRMLRRLRRLVWFGYHYWSTGK